MGSLFSSLETRSERYYCFLCTKILSVHILDLPCRNAASGDMVKAHGRPQSKRIDAAVEDAMQDDLTAERRQEHCRFHFY